MRAWFCILTCLLIVPAIAKEKRPAASKPSPACSFNYASELKIARSFADMAGWGVYPIEGADVGKFMTIFNAAEPKTDFKAEQIVVSVNPKFAYVEIFVGGCVSHKGKLALSDFDALMRQAYGGELPDATAI
jgi:hypothetical protein